MVDQHAKFKDLAAAHKNRGVAFDLWMFLKANKKWWLVPFLILFLLMGLLAFFAGTGAAPFIYTLF